MSNLKRDRGLLWLVKRILKSYPLHILVVLISIVTVAVTTVIGTRFLQSLVDEYIAPLILSGEKDFSNLDIALFRLTFVCMLGVLAAFLQSRTMVFVGQGTIRDLRIELFRHMEKLSVSYFDSNQFGNIMSIYTNDVDSLRQFIGVSFPNLISSIVTLVSVFISMLFVNIPLSILTLILTLLVVYASNKSASIAMKHFVRQQEQIADMNAYVEEMMSGQKVIKVFSHESQVKEEFCLINEELRKSASLGNAYANILMPIINQLGKFSYVISAIVAATGAVYGFIDISVGGVIAFLALVQNFNQPLSQIAQQLNAVIMASAGVSRLNQLLEAKLEEDAGKVSLVSIELKDKEWVESDERTGIWAWKVPEADTFILEKVEGDIRFEDVDFSYTKDKQILYNINLYAKPAQKIAFVGSTGAGKTTISNLLNSFYDIDKGSITYDGINIKDIRKSDLRKSLGIVLQDTHLFTGTVMDNIRYGRPEASDMECIGAARLANAHGFIERLPEGYNTMINGDGSSLSQGQRQLLAIARAALADPPVLILDEATSSIDTHTERLVQRGMDSLMNGRTSFVIAHRLSTVRNSDCIMVLEAGKIIERGSHEELLSLKGRYHKLYTGMNMEA